MSAAKAVNLTTALVSMFSLETALIARFGGNQAYFRLVMTSCTAFAGCVTVLGIDDYVVKPFELDELQLRTGTFLSASRPFMLRTNRITWTI